MPSNAFNASTASTAMMCVSTTCTITLLQRLLRLSTQLLLFEVFFFGSDSDSSDSETTCQLPTCDCLHMGTTLETGGSMFARIKRSSSTSPEHGERVICGPDKATYVDCIQGVVAATTDNNLLYDVCGNLTQQLAKRQICNDSTIYVHLCNN